MNYDPIAEARRWSVTTLRDAADRLAAAPDAQVAEVTVHMSAHIEALAREARSLPPAPVGLLDRLRRWVAREKHSLLWITSP